MGWPSSPRRWPDFQSIRLRGLAGQTRSLRLTTSTRSFPRQPAQNSRTELSLAPFTCTLAVSNAPLVAPPPSDLTRLAQLAPRHCAHPFLR